MPSWTLHGRNVIQPTQVKAFKASSSVSRQRGRRACDHHPWRSAGAPRGNDNVSGGAARRGGAGLDFFSPCALEPLRRHQKDARAILRDVQPGLAALAELSLRGMCGSSPRYRHVAIRHRSTARKNGARHSSIMSAGARGYTSLMAAWNRAGVRPCSASRPRKRSLLTAPRSWTDIVERAYDAEEPFDHRGAPIAEGVVRGPERAEAAAPLPMNAAIRASGGGLRRRALATCYSHIHRHRERRRHVRRHRRTPPRAAGGTIGVYTVCQRDLPREPGGGARPLSAATPRRGETHEAVRIHMEGKATYSRSHDEWAVRLSCYMYVWRACRRRVYPLVGSPRAGVADIAIIRPRRAISARSSSFLQLEGGTALLLRPASIPLLKGGGAEVGLGVRALAGAARRGSRWGRGAAGGAVRLWGGRASGDGEEGRAQRLLIGAWPAQDPERRWFGWTPFCCAVAAPWRRPKAGVPVLAVHRARIEGG